MLTDVAVVFLPDAHGGVAHFHQYLCRLHPPLLV